MTSFRDKHIQIVTRYIIIPAKKGAAAQQAGLNLAVASSKISAGEGGKKEEIRGTGGTTLIPFLRQARDETLGATV